MRIATEKQQKRHQRFLEKQLRNRWAYTALYSFWVLESIQRIFVKRAQWPHLLHYPFSLVPFWGSIWVNIFSLVLFPFIITQLWLRIHNYRQEQLAAEQEALRKAASPTDGVWPPPPQSPI